MKKIFIAVLAGLVAVCSAAGNVEVCQKDCGLSCGQCMIRNPMGIEACLQEEAACALECLKGLTVQAGDVGVCEKDCGISCGQCMIRNPMGIEACLQEEAACSLECLKGLTV